MTDAAQRAAAKQFAADWKGRGDENQVVFKAEWHSIVLHLWA